MAASSSVSPLFHAPVPRELDCMSNVERRTTRSRYRNSVAATAPALSPSRRAHTTAATASATNSKLIATLVVGGLLICTTIYGGALCRWLYVFAQHISLSVFATPSSTLSLSCTSLANNTNNNNNNSSCLWHGRVDSALSSVDDWRWTNARGADCVLESNASITLNASAHTGRFSGYAVSSSGGYCTGDGHTLCVACPRWRFTLHWLDARGQMLAKTAQRIHGPELCVARYKLHFDVPFHYQPNGDAPFVHMQVTAQCV